MKDTPSDLAGSGELFRSCTSCLEPSMKLDKVGKSSKFGGWGSMTSRNRLIRLNPWYYLAIIWYLRALLSYWLKCGCHPLPSKGDSFQCDLEKGWSPKLGSSGHLAIGAVSCHRCRILPWLRPEHFKVQGSTNEQCCRGLRGMRSNWAPDFRLGMGQVVGFPRIHKNSS